ncbi:Contactin-5 [Ranunculus cassubicifolius]
MSSSKVVSSVFLARYKLLGVEKLSIGSSSNFIYHSRLQVNKYSSWNVLSSTSLAEKGVEGIMSDT